MVRALHDNDVLLLGGVTSELHGSLDSFRARVPEEESIQAFMRHDGNELLNELEVRLLESDVDLAVDKLAHLVLCSLGDSRVTMAQVGDTNASGEVEVFATAHHAHIATVSALDDLWREATDAFGDMLSAELDEFLGGSAHVEVSVVA